MEDLSLKKPEEILQINVIHNSEQIVETLSSIEKLNSRENELLNQTYMNKQFLNIEVIEMQINLIDIFSNRNDVLKKIKKEYENHIILLDGIYNKIKSNANQKSQWEELKEEVQDSLKSIYSDLMKFSDMPKEIKYLLKEIKEKNNLKKVTRDKELEIMRSFIANYNSDIILSHEKIENLKFSYYNLTQIINKKLEEIEDKERLIEKLKISELNYLNQKSNLIDKIIFNAYNKESDEILKSSEIVYDLVRISENFKHMLNTIQYLNDRIQTTNNRKNLNVFNETLQFFNKKMFQISHIIQDKFMIDLLIRSKLIGNRLYSNIQIENDFQLIKRDIFYLVFKNYYASNPNNSFLNLIGIPLSKATELILKFYKVNPIDETKDSKFVKYLKALCFLNLHIKERDFTSAYKYLNYFKDDEALQKLLQNLNIKLKNTAQEICAIDIMKNHLK